MCFFLYQLLPSGGAAADSSASPVPWLLLRRSSLHPSTEKALCPSSFPSSLCPLLLPFTLCPHAHKPSQPFVFLCVLFKPLHHLQLAAGFYSSPSWSHCCHQSFSCSLLLTLKEFQHSDTQQVMDSNINAWVLFFCFFYYWFIIEWEKMANSDSKFVI